MAGHFNRVVSGRMTALRVSPAMSKLGAWIRPVDDAREVPLLHRLAIIYLMLPVFIWLVGWFEWWLGVPAAVLLAAAFWQALGGSWRGKPRAAAVAVIVVAVCWAMSTAAGGVLDLQNGDWLKHRTILLDLGRYPWPTFLQSPLSVYTPNEVYSPPLLRYYLGYYMTPGLAAHWLGPAALNWAVPLWTCIGAALMLLMFTRERRGWGAALAALIFILFSGMDFARVALFGVWDWIHPPIDWSWWLRISVGAEHFESGRVVLPVLSNMTNLMWVPQHFISAGLCTLSMLQLRGNQRFLSVSGVLLAGALFWSPFVAIGLLPLGAALFWGNGVRPFLRWPNLLLAAPLAALIVSYLASGSTDFPSGWIWERYEWTLLAWWMPMVYLTEFVLLLILVWALRPDLRREPFFIVCAATLILLPLYYIANNNVLLPRASLPPLLLLCWYCAETIAECGLRRIHARRWYSAGIACIVVILAIGSITAFVELARGARNAGMFRFENSEYTTLLHLPRSWQKENTAYDIPNALRLLLDEDELVPPERERGELIVRSAFDVYLEEDGLVLVKEVCGRDDIDNRFFLHTVPVDPANLPVDRQPLGFDYSRDWPVYESRIIGEGACVLNLPMPEYAVAGFRVGQQAQDGSVDWEADYNFEPDFNGLYASLTFGEASVRSKFDIYFDGNRLTYAKAPCTPVDAGLRFFLHVFPVDDADLPGDRRRYGFHNLDFDFSEVGFLHDRRCAAVRFLPNYEVAKIVTGQFTGRGRVWSEEFSVAGE